MKTPISYYGGKQNMLGEILPLIPEHKIYVEPFFGGGAVFFAKTPAPTSVINDTNDWAITFYRQCKENFSALHAKINGTLHSESEHRKAREILKNSPEYTPLDIAWAFWVQTNLSFANGIFKGFAFSLSKREVKATQTRITRFTQEINTRLQNAVIFSRDALDIIQRYDTPETFFYLDPPYISSDCGHYAGTWDNDKQNELLQLLPNLKGKYLLSGYPQDLPTLAGAQRKELTKGLSVSGKQTIGKTKTETLIYNYKRAPTLFEPTPNHNGKYHHQHQDSPNYIFF